MTMIIIALPALAGGAAKAAPGFISLSSSKAMRAVLISTLSASLSEFLNQQYLEYVYMVFNATIPLIEILVLKMPIFLSSEGHISLKITLSIV